MAKSRYWIVSRITAIIVSTVTIITTITVIVAITAITDITVIDILVDSQLWSLTALSLAFPLSLARGFNLVPELVRSRAVPSLLNVKDALTTCTR